MSIPKKDLVKLQKEFPDLTQSVLGDVLSTYQNDKEQAAVALRGISEELKKENDKKIAELKEMFPTLSNQIIGEELDKCKGNVDNAIAPLFSKTQEMQKKEKKKQDAIQRKKKQEEEAKRRQEEEKKQANSLMEIFKNIPKEKVQQLLDENEGDIEETTAQLLVVVAKQEEEAKLKEKQVAKQKAEEEEKKRRLEQEQRMKELKFQALKDKFEELSDDQVNHVLNANDWDIKKALADLYVVCLKQKKKEIKELFSSFRDEEIEMALENNNQDKIKAVNVLTQEREKRKARVEARNNAKNIAREKREAKKKNKKKTNKKKETTKPVDSKPVEEVKKVTETLKELEIKPKEEVKPSSPVSSTPIKSEKEEEDEDDEEEDVIEEEETEAPLITQQVVISKVKQNALERSMILGQMIEQEIAETQQEESRMKKEQKQAVQALFRNNLENIIEKQARGDSLPGITPPPLPKQIDAILGKNKPVVEPEATLNLSTKQQDLPQRGSNISDENSSKALITLTVKQPIVDVGNNVVVDWEITSGVSSAWDWVGLFPVDKTNKQYVTYQWSGKQLMKGSLTFVAPNVYGEYEFRFFPNGYYEHATMSNRFKVGPQIELTGRLDKENNKIVARWNQISGNLYSKSWIGLYEKSETNNNNYIHFEYAGKPNTDLLFDAPFKPREYELRFFTNSYVDVARSESIRIEGNDTISATFENGMVNVKLNIVTIDPTSESGWLGVYFTHETNNRQWRRYKYFSSRIGDCSFKAPRTQGTYEVRLFANKTYDMILKSNCFVIPPQEVATTAITNTTSAESNVNQQ